MKKAFALVFCTLIAGSLGLAQSSGITSRWPVADDSQGRLKTAEAEVSACDLNGDGTVSVEDYYRGVQIVLSLNPSGFDLDCDKLATVADLLLLVNVILEKVPCPSCVVTTTTTTTSTSTTRPTGPSTTTTTQPFGSANLKIEFTPNPTPDIGGGKHNIDRVKITETNGVGVNLASKFKIQGTEYDVTSFFGSTRINPRDSLEIPPPGLTLTIDRPVTAPVEIFWDFTGTDDLGSDPLSWRSVLMLSPFSSTKHALLNIEFDPNPVGPNDDGNWPFTIRLKEANGVGVTITGLNIEGSVYNANDIRTILGSLRVEPNGTLSATSMYTRSFGEGPAEWIITGTDDNSHTDLRWRARHLLVAFANLLSGISQTRQVKAVGYLPFQYRIYVPPGTASLTIDLTAIDSGPNALSMYLRAGSPVGNTIGIPPFNPVADFSLANIGSGSVVVHAGSSPPLRTGVPYYIAIGNSITGVQPRYTIRGTASTSSVGTTSTLATTTTSTTTSTRVSTTTTTTSSTSSTRVSTTTTSTSSTTSTRPSTTTTSSVGTTTTSSTTTTRPSTTTTSSGGTTTTTSAVQRPAFNPSLTLSLDPLTAGSKPTVKFVFRQNARELYLRTAELTVSAGRMDFTVLTPGQELGSATMSYQGISVLITHVITSNTGSTVTAEFRASATVPILGTLRFVIARGTYQNTGQDGILIRITTESVSQSGFSMFTDGDTMGSTSVDVPFEIGKIFTLPNQAGRSFTANTKFISVLWPKTGGTPTTVDGPETSFTTTP